MKRNFIVLILAALPFVGTLADSVRFLILDSKDGSKTEFALVEEPKLSFANGELNIISSSRTFSISLSDIEKYAFSEESTGIKDVLKDFSLKLENGFVIFSGLSIGSKVSSYMQDGKMIKEFKADDKGSALLDLSVLPKGILIIKSNKTSIKIINR